MAFSTIIHSKWYLSGGGAIESTAEPTMLKWREILVFAYENRQWPGREHPLHGFLKKLRRIGQGRNQSGTTAMPPTVMQQARKLKLFEQNNQGRARALDLEYLDKLMAKTIA